MITKIKKGDRFICIKPLCMGGSIPGKVYLADEDIILLEPGHEWSFSQDREASLERFSKYFIPYTYEALHEHMCTIKYDDPEAKAFRELLKDLDRAIGRSIASGGNYRSRLADPDTKHEMNVEEIRLSSADAEAIDQLTNDPVNHPSHYTDGKIEVIDFIEDKWFGYNLGNAVKYISRAGKKDPSKTVQDLQKAVWYVEREIARLQGRKEASCE